MSPGRPSGLGGRRAAIAEHERKRAGEVVGQGAAALLFPHGEQEEQEQEEQEEHLQRERRAARLLEQPARLPLPPPPPPRLQTQDRNTREVSTWGPPWGAQGGEDAPADL